MILMGHLFQCLEVNLLVELLPVGIKVITMVHRAELYNVPDGQNKIAIRAEKINYGDKMLVLIECANRSMKYRRDHHVQYGMHMEFFL